MALSRHPGASLVTEPASPSRGGVFMETYGCQMNGADSEVVLSILAEAGWRRVDEPSAASVVLLNTCAIRDNAEAKVWQRLGYYRSLKRSTPRGSQRVVVGVLGCMAERLKQKLLESDRMVDLVAGPDAKALNVQLSADETYADVAPLRRAGERSAYLSIMRGCNNMCAFCIVPYVRGRERSRPIQSILEEVRRLSESGVKEVTLLGQNVNSYADFSESAPEPGARRGEDPSEVYAAGFTSVYRPRRAGAVSFAELLDRAAAVDPEMRVRFTSPHPKDFGEDVIAVIAARPNICKQLHMPAQSGSSEVLRAMRRGYSRDAYDALAERVRAALPGVALSTDMISGFCGETERDHAASVDLMRRHAFEAAFMFAYSDRERTYAARHLADDVPEPDKLRRLSEIIAAFREGLERRAAEERGRLHIVLQQNLIDLQPGDYVAVRVERATTGSTGGTLHCVPIAKTSIREFVDVFGSSVPLDTGLAREWPAVGAGEEDQAPVAQQALVAAAS
ncbi:hypothetical protein QBZ16_004870 [Prototheca wickerhamii]|uniref:Uncharacterized protein n=1 Tax=Prototheca wickerhamii TaxID=3111 RepID=A0AAD9MMN5_PROWI|nr:hypothetical protein QBZ16_004870 [Prototheca wickerhamii]